MHEGSPTPETLPAELSNDGELPHEQGSTTPETLLAEPASNDGELLHEGSPTTETLPAEPASNDGKHNYHPNLATHAERNTTNSVQAPRTLSKLSDSQKASQLLRRMVNQEAHQRLIEDFDSLLQRHAQELEELAEKHDVKGEYLEKLKGTSKHYKGKREVNIENAKIHMKSVEMNADRELGDRLRIAEIRQLVKDDPKFQDLSKAQETELRDELLSARELKRLGARPSNRSAAQDYRHHVEHLNDEITSLSERTGAAAVCFFTRTNLEDTFEPNWICSPNAAHFTEDSFNRNMWDIARLFELWACTKAKVRNPDSLQSIREQCSKLINGGLKTASKVDSVAMNYQNYDTQIIQRLGVKLVGWTHHILVSPYEIYTIDDLRTLRDALVCGACFWMRLSKREITQHKADIERRELMGEVVTKKRKERSDKGVRKGPSKKRGAQEAVDDSDKEDDPVAGPSKKRKVGAKEKGKGKLAATKKAKAAAKAKSQLPPSNELLSDTDLEDFE